ncbi:MAG: GNAT family N-acetyltransferase [Caldilineaceae bacterium]|nr:GNAT family N-acetyltransferase [Caldilineaceae bacterium]
MKRPGLLHLRNYPPLATRRMLLVPLTLEQMQMQLDDYAQLERSLGAQISGNRLEREMRPIVARSIAYMKQTPEDAIWNTFWAALLIDEGVMTGGIGFKGPANGEGEVEIGYGFDAPYRNRGLATEAVLRLSAWAFAQPGVSSLIADTHYMNVPSARVLQKAGFLLYAAHNHFLYWRKTRPESCALQ